MGLLNRVKRVKIPTHEFNIQIPIIQKENLLTPEENNTLAQYIISLGDVQESKTFVKASMSDWQLHTHNNIAKKLCDKALDIILESSGRKSSVNPPKFYTRKCWGAIYGKGDWVQEHNHVGSIYGWCYYIRMPKGSSPLVFPEGDLSIQPKEGELIVFPGIVKHSVPPCDCEEKRIMIASNVGVK